MSGRAEIAYVGHAETQASQLSAHFDGSSRGSPRNRSGSAAAPPGNGEVW